VKWGRFLLGLAGGAVVGYMLVQTKEIVLRPENVIQSLKERYKEKLSILGSWIYIEPQLEEVNGMQYRIYHCGLTGMSNGQPNNLQFKVNAETGEVLLVID
jgi:predicted small secreted protein